MTSISSHWIIHRINVRVNIAVSRVFEVLKAVGEKRETKRMGF